MWRSGFLPWKRTERFVFGNMYSMFHGMGDVYLVEDIVRESQEMQM